MKCAKRHSLFVARRHLVSIGFAFVLLPLAMWTLTSRALAETFAPPTISNARILTHTVAQFEKFEIEFDVTTSATHLDLPYDTEPPPGVAPKIGVSVDALFSADNWRTSITQPAFFYQPYTHQTMGDGDHFVPTGPPRWLVRFAPRAGGDWQVRLRVQDAGGETVYPTEGALRFEAITPGEGRYQGLRSNPYTRHGFLRVSEKDSRYFEFEDGTPFLGVGYNAGSESVATVRQRYRDWQMNGLTFARVWMSGAGINASQWTPWSFPRQPYNFGLPATLLDSEQHFGDADFSFRLNPNFPCLFVDFWQGGIPVQPSTVYSITVQAKLFDVTPRANASDAGFTLLQQGWINNNCENLTNSPLIPPRTGTTDWFTSTTTFTTGASQNFLNYLYLALQNIEKGWAYIDHVQVTARDDPAQVNLVRHGQADSHMYFDSMNAAEWDLFIEQAAQHGVYLKIVSDEKNEWIRNSIQADGTVGKFNNNNFYAANNTKVRWLDQAWWRYLIARWGYSTAIHSFEFVNEGDPYNGNHYGAANAMALYFDKDDPSQHMVTTSMWHSFPNPEFWSNPKFSALDYTDLHAYISTGWGEDASFIPSKNLETRPEYQYEGNNSYHIPANQKIQDSIAPRGMTLHETGEWTIRYWMKQENFKAKCGYGEGGSNVRVYWHLDTGQHGIVPQNVEGKDFLCTAPDGTFGWREFNTQVDREGKEIPIEHRLVISDTLPHALTLGVSNVRGVSGDAWISNVELVSPSGTRVPIIGKFDNTPFPKDTAWLTAAYSELWGGKSPVGALKPLVRGETGVNSQEFPNGLPGLNDDKQGIWLHNFVWGQINPGGMYDLWWWGTQNIENNEKSGRTGNLYGVFMPYAAFMADVPLNSGAYRDANAVSDNSNLRVWGQRDDKAGRAQLWIQNRLHTWDRVVSGETIEPARGTIQLANMSPGMYRVEWWDTYRPRDAITKVEKIQVQDTLTLNLPAPLANDIAVKIERSR